jgi:hypothetical protein
MHIFKDDEGPHIKEYRIEAFPRKIKRVELRLGRYF